jgi:carboxymethylenebutenolidase
MRMKTILLSLIALAALAQDPLARLEKSPRHQEWVQIEHGGRILHAFVVYPEISAKATSVLVIHENQGLTDWVRSMADQFAEAGFIAIAPDLLSGYGPNGGRTKDYAPGTAREGIAQLKPEGVTADLNAAADYVIRLPAANGKLAVVGFCWGGSNTFRFATNRRDLKAAFPFYGTGPMEPEAIARITAPVYGFYGGNDARVNATIPNSEELMKAAGKKYEPVIYEGAGHGFMRSGEAADALEANRKARAAAWTRLIGLLKAL